MQNASPATSHGTSGSPLGDDRHVRRKRGCRLMVANRCKPRLPCRPGYRGRRPNHRRELVARWELIDERLCASDHAPSRANGLPPPTASGSGGEPAPHGSAPCSSSAPGAGSSESKRPNCGNGDQPRCARRTGFEAVDGRMVGVSALFCFGGSALRTHLRGTSIGCSSDPPRSLSDNISLKVPGALPGPSTVHGNQAPFSMDVTSAASPGRKPSWRAWSRENVRRNGRWSVTMVENSWALKLWMGRSLTPTKRSPGRTPAPTAQPPSDMRPTVTTPGS
mmetsp:Transcript_109288/g.315875  ORF Transcript_109288/g.315875 Transcript_109288/m.315875 type:complete len:278 (-) Transcript_109288:216-1049(-)